MVLNCMRESLLSLKKLSVFCTIMCLVSHKTAFLPHLVNFTVSADVSVQNSQLCLRPWIHNLKSYMQYV